MTNMSDKNYQNEGQKVALNITQDKLVDILIHAATREDIASLRTENREMYNQLDKKIDTLAIDHNHKIDKLDQKVDTVSSDLNHKIDKLDSKIDSNFKMMLSVLIVTILVPIALHFVK